MGNSMCMSFCFQSNSKSTSVVKLIFWEGTTRTIFSNSSSSSSSAGAGNNKLIAGEIMFQFPDKMICHADSFYIGQTIPSLSISDQLVPGETYFVLPVDRFACKNLSIAALSSFGNSCTSSSNGGSSTTTNVPKPKPKPINFAHECPFQYVKGVDGRMLIKVLPEFLVKLMTRGEANGGAGTVKAGDDCGSPNSINSSFLCSTPELKKHYDDLVGSTKEKVWSPKLETISESKTRLSPCSRFIGFGPPRSSPRNQLIKV